MVEYPWSQLFRGPSLATVSIVVRTWDICFVAGISEPTSCINLCEYIWICYSNILKVWNIKNIHNERPQPISVNYYFEVICKQIVIYIDICDIAGCLLDVLVSPVSIMSLKKSGIMVQYYLPVAGNILNPVILTIAVYTLL